MPRPCKNRKIGGKASLNYFKPVGIPMKELEEVIITKDEFESIRLVYEKELSQNESSKKMQISQPTFSRILTSGIKKITNAVVNAKAIKFEK